MSRVQLALNVSDIDAAVDFYSRLFGTAPAKRQPGYANFAIANPPLKLVLIENPVARGSGVTGALNHLGVEVSTPLEVQEAVERLSGEGLSTEVQESTTCCFAVQDKVWANDPDGAPWEYYTVLADASDSGGTGVLDRRLFAGSVLLTLQRRCARSERPCLRSLSGGGCRQSSSAALSWPQSSSDRVSQPNSSRRGTPAFNSCKMPPPPPPGSSP